MSYELFVPLVCVRVPQAQLASSWQERVTAKNSNLLPTKPDIKSIHKMVILTFAFLLAAIFSYSWKAPRVWPQRRLNVVIHLAYQTL